MQCANALHINLLIRNWLFICEHMLFTFFMEHVFSISSVAQGASHFTSDESFHIIRHDHRLGHLEIYTYNLYIYTYIFFHL